MNNSEHLFWVEFEGGKLVLYGKSAETATIFLDRLIAAQDDQTIREAVREKFRGECLVISMPVDCEFVDKQMIFTIPLKTQMRKEMGFLKMVQRDLENLLSRMREGARNTIT